ncbi:methyl-accepting chemotaxis protein [Bacterioplanoides sp.]|uniref:methyl-accepting chemotaxis protein n=1 Tax=Bacterioplanoides sp. TaxID=2066072 RepID=UPI003AFFC257
MTEQTFSIQKKVYLALGLIFLVMMLVVVSIAVSSEEELAHDMVHAQLRDKASGYLDTMNILMISGAMHNREAVREKLTSDNSITEARMMRSAKVNALYGEGLPHEAPQDELDRRAMNGESAFVEHYGKDGHTLTFVRPVVAQQNYRGTNCLACHQAQEGDILGAIRITYNLDELDNNIQSNMLKMAGIQIAMCLAALFVLSFLLRKFMLRPIRHIHRGLSAMEQHSDLTQQVEVMSSDELGQTAQALNSMTQRFSDSLHQVVQSVEQLEGAAQHIDTTSRHSKNAADQQNVETEQIQQSISTLQSNISQVMHNAEQSSQASVEAKTVASDGVSKTDQASLTIENMHQAMQQTSEVVTSLDEKTASVGGVLEVIKGIAEQTNLLALNAAIEAARAGESGRGFAVVADEVRTLSQRTHESAQEIETMIEQLQQEADKAVSSMQTAQDTATEGLEQVREAASALHRMTQHVDQMTQLNAETLSQMQQQVSIGDDVTRSINTIGEHSRNTVNSAEETTQVSSNLVSLANNLTRLVKQFKL